MVIAWWCCFRIWFVLVFVCFVDCGWFVLLAGGLVIMCLVGVCICVVLWVLCLVVVLCCLIVL